MASLESTEALGVDGALLERFEREAKLLSSLNVVALYDVGVQVPELFPTRRRALIGSEFVSAHLRAWSGATKRDVRLCCRVQIDLHASEIGFGDREAPRLGHPRRRSFAF